MANQPQDPPEARPEARPDDPGRRDPGNGLNRITSFSQLLTLLEDGELNAELSRLQHEVIEALANHAIDTGKVAAGGITLKLDFKLKEGVFEVNGDVSTRTPKAERRRSIFWSTPDNHLTPENPRQHKLFQDIGGSRGVKAV